MMDGADVVGNNTGADLRMMLENEDLLGDFLTLKIGVISEVNFQVCASRMGEESWS